MKVINKIFVCVIIIFTITACEDNFLDINTDPNNPTDAALFQLLPAAQTNMGFVFGYSNGGLNSHAAIAMHHFSRRGNLNDYGIQGNDFAITTSWNSLFAGALTDIETMISKAIESEDWHYVAVSQIMKAYIFATMVDLWGDVPYFESNQGSSNTSPVFDGGAAIYADLQVQLDEAIANLGLASAFTPASDDLFYGGDLTKWRKLAKTLKLKLYNNVRLVQNVDAEINTLLGENDLITAFDDFELEYGTSLAPENRNPGYVQEWTAGGAFNYISPYFYEIMRSADTFNHQGIQFGVIDPRVPYYFFNQLQEGSGDADAQNPCSYCPSRAGTSFLSIWAYSFNIDPNEGFDQSQSQTVAGLYPLGGRYDDGQGGIAANAASLTAGQVAGQATTAQRLLTYDELLFMQAELAQEGVSSGDARSLLSDAIDAAFNKVNAVASEAAAPAIDAMDITNYRDAVLGVYDAGDASQRLEVIMTQKWIAGFGNSLVSYNDYRRTGFPRLHDGNTDNLNVTVQTRQFPLSFPYDIGNLQLNPNAPSQRIIASDKVFWDN